MAMNMLREEKKTELFTIEHLPFGVYVSISPLCYSDPARYRAEVEARIMEMGIEDVDYAVIGDMFDGRVRGRRGVAPPQYGKAGSRVEAKLSSNGNQVFVLIERPGGGADALSKSDVLRAISDAGAGGFLLDYSTIDRMIKSRAKNGFMLVGVRQDGDAIVSVSDDGMVASVMLTEPFGGEAIDDVKEIKERLIDFGVVHGIMYDEIEKLVRRKVYNEPAIVAVGTQPSHGCDGKIEYYFNMDKRVLAPSIDEEGNADFKNLGVFESVNAGAPLACRVPALAGSEGMDIYGNIIPAKPGKNAALLAGANTRAFADDPDLIVAAIDGQPKMASGKVCVFPAIEIQGDVDYGTGNVSFMGSVRVRGNVQYGFSVKAAGDIIVDGIVDGGSLDADGDIVVKQGIVGQEVSRVIAKGRLSTRHIDKANVYAGGSVFVEESIVFSEVKSEEDIKLNGCKGYIIGGVACAGREIFAHQIGAKGGPATTLQVGASPKIRDERKRLISEIADIESKKDRHNKTLSTIGRRIEASGEDDSLRTIGAAVRKELRGMMSRQRICHEKLNEIENLLLRGSNVSQRINVTRGIYPGAAVAVGALRMVCEEYSENTTFFSLDGRIECVPCEVCD